MRTLYLLVVIYIAMILNACTVVTRTPVAPPQHHTEETVTPTHYCHHHKDPVNVSFLNHSYPDRPYKILGEAKVSKFNSEGIKRQEATIRDLIRDQAASLDGDAIINIKADQQTITATVIGFRKDLV
jgi:hypothetical protein